MKLRLLYGTDEPTRQEQGLAVVAVVMVVALVVLILVGAPSPWTEVAQVVFYATLLTLWFLAVRRRRGRRKS